MSNAVLQYSEVDIGTWKYKEPTKNKRGGMNAYIDAPNGRSPQFQLGEKMRVPFGIRDSGLDGSGADNPRKNMELSVDDPALQAFFEAVDDKNIEVASTNSESWFKKKLDKEQLSDALYRHSLSQTDERFAPLVRLKVAGTGSRVPTRIFIAEQEGDTIKYRSGNITDVTKNCHVTPIVKLGGLWFISKGFGCTFECTDLLVYKAPDAESAFPFTVSDATVDAGSGGGSAGSGNSDDIM